MQEVNVLIGYKNDNMGRPTKRPDAETLNNLYYIKNMTSTEIGKMYGVKASTVRSWVTYYRKLYRQQQQKD